MFAISSAISTANIRSATEVPGTRTAEAGSPAGIFADLMSGSQESDSRTPKAEPESTRPSADREAHKGHKVIKKLRASARDLTTTSMQIKDQQALGTENGPGKAQAGGTLEATAQEQPQPAAEGKPEWSAWMANLLQVDASAAKEPKLDSEAAVEGRAERLKNSIHTPGPGHSALNAGPITDLQTTNGAAESGIETVKSNDVPIDSLPSQPSAASRTAHPEAPTTALQTMAPAAISTGAKDSPPTPSATFESRMDTALQIHLNSAGFTPAFSARVATLVRDGVEHARVHLNPVDMGLVSLQMSLDGQQVRVDMTADLAATRRVLEQALPTLAGALREAGFTLSGGGVHQPPPEARSGAAQDTGPNMPGNSQGSSTADTLGTAAGGAGGQGQAANPFRQDPRDQGAQTLSGVITVGEEALQAASGGPTVTAPQRGSQLVDVFA